ncbi:glycoside hydrolase family 15 protein [Peterkaempfera bronchialis]|uniref:Glycoside hydrolase family 15 protein n=1 Tax=Peterkaempfera bronchialis TaxID=2126346 RepID=A0A345T2E3_9ACTN|nr:glycoside hydrolase family 15 protein [Peterkaempfera bronchialis]AXI80148.1 glycoside hydrolase family 15 protein [Peterkaempfera bronchialis]
MSARPIGDHALLSDCRSAALVTSDGSVDWLCLPRFDSPAIFARLLDEDAGHWSIRPTGPADISRRYVEDTLVLETTFRTTGGTAVLHDALALGRRERGHALGTASPGMLLRQITCTEGQVDIETSYAPRPEYGLVHPLLSVVRGGLAAYGGAYVLLLSSPVDLRVNGSTAHGRIPLSTGHRLEFALHVGPAWESEPAGWRAGRIRRRMSDTIKGWRSWSKLHRGYVGPWQDEVGHSGRVLRALTFAPTGAIVAAATTSLPEKTGGMRNWDYRYTWVRDASFTIQALSTAACEKERNRFFGFLARAAATQLDRGADLQIMYGIGGERDLSERLLLHLTGWRNSGPVRIGNDAWRQRQLDVYGELLDAAHQTLPPDEPLDPATRTLLLQAAETAARQWTQPDQGIWERRGPSRHFLHSKLMCWVALDRAITMAPALQADERLPHWQHERDLIRQAIEQRGWSPGLGAFTQAFDSDELDASALMLPIVGFLPPHEPRVQSTVLAVATQLTDRNGLVRRYLTDELQGEEGTFLLCTFWLAQALALTGHTTRARHVFQAALAHANDLGLLAEETDATTAEALGNFPQAFSHIGLINAARAIRDAERQTRPCPPEATAK